MSDLDRALAWAKVVQHETNDDETMILPTTAAIMAKHLLAEHERAEKAETINRAALDKAQQLADANAADARRWRTWRAKRPSVLNWRTAEDAPKQWRMSPDMMDITADRLAAEQEAS